MRSGSPDLPARVACALPPPAPMADADAKWDAYHDTVLEIPGADGAAPLRVDLRCPDVPALIDRLRAAGVTPPVAILTAENPFGENAEDEPGPQAERRAAARNDQRHEALLAELREAGLPFARVDGVAPDGSYRERCVAVPLPHDAARTLARRLRQLAFFCVERDGVWLAPGLADREPERLPAA